MKIVILVAIGLLVIAGWITVGCERIDAGHAGVKVELYGTNRGVQDIELVTGWVWYNRFSSVVYEFPTYIQNKVWTADLNEDHPLNQEFTITTKDAMALRFDVGFQYSVEPNKVSDIFRKYRVPLKEITDIYLRTTVRDVYNGIGGSMTAEELLSNRKVYEDSVRHTLVRMIEPDGFTLHQVSIIGKIRTPPALEDAINSKITAVQNAQRAENEKQQTIAEAQKLIESARGDSASWIIRAKAEAETNRLRSQTLTPLLIQQQLITKWDGALPVYGTVPTIFRDVSK